MATVDLTYVASGFQEDCNRLLEKYKEQQSIQFNTFCKAWKEMKFSLVFLCRKTHAEMLEFCEESLKIAKQIALSSTYIIDQISGLYLLYGLYYKIPLENVKIRVTMKEWQMFLQIHKQIKLEKLHDASYIFVKLVHDNAFYHCLFSNELGLEKSLKMQEHSTEPSDNSYSILPSITDDLDHGELANLQMLSSIYSEQKSKLVNSLSTKHKLQLFDENFMDEITNNIDSLQEKRNTSSSKKKSTVTSLSKLCKTKYPDNRIRPKIGHGFDTDSSEDENYINDTDFRFINVDQGLPSNFDKDEDTENPRINKKDVDEIDAEESSFDSEDEEKLL